MSRRVHLVGSIGLDTVDEVFTTVGRLLGPHLKRVPDGEVGGRRMWISWQAPLLRANPFLQLDSSSPQLSDFAPLRIADGVDPEEIQFGELGYAREARASYLDFLSAQSRGDLPSAVRFQVSLPTPWAIVGVGRFSRADFPHVFRAYDRAMLDELARICDAIPHEHLSVQWDVAHEMIIYDGRWQAPYEMWRPFPGMGEYFADNVARFITAVPAEVETGFHLCYGDRDGRHFIEPLDSGKLVEFATLVVERIDRPLNWLHIPVPIDRYDYDYYAPLHRLRLPGGAELYLGLVHAADGVDGTRRRIAVAEHFVPEFGIAAECGFARARRQDVVKQFLVTHAGAAAL
jgi:hypothetical protein